MALAQATNEAGNITLEATAPGLTAATLSIATRTKAIRPQVAVWERDVPAGPGITGLWRPDPAAVDVGGYGGTAGVFTFQQDGGTLTGSVEGASARWGWGGSETQVPIKDGRVDGDRFSFRAGSFTYTGTLKGDTIEIQRTGGPSRRGSGVPAEPAGPRPAIGPPPDGSDPSRSEFVGLGRPERAAATIALHRAKR
jgi:beta-galactosidase